MISVRNIHTVAHCMNIFDRISVRNICATTSFVNILDLTCHSEHFWDETDLFGYFEDGSTLLNLFPNESSPIFFGKNSLVGSSILKITFKAQLGCPHLNRRPVMFSCTLFYNHLLRINLNMTSSLSYS